MLALSPAQFSNINVGCWPLEEGIIGQINEDQNFLYEDLINSSILGSTFREFGPDFAPPSDHLNSHNHNNNSSNNWAQAEIGCSDLNVAVTKKLNHNASERDRRKKINCMYSSLRALLPSSDHSKKLSIPATVSRVLKYIPEIQQEVEELVQKRDELLARINSTQQINFNNSNRKTKHSCESSSFSVSGNQLNDKEVSVQISTTNEVQLVKPLSRILQTLERAGLSLLNASAFESPGGRVFHNLHLQVQESYNVECGKLDEKLKSLCDIKELLQ